MPPFGCENSVAKVEQEAAEMLLALVARVPEAQLLERRRVGGKSQDALQVEDVCGGWDDGQDVGLA
jgi:hypothetical protein